MNSNASVGQYIYSQQ